jgi:hypothetical protein
VDWTLYENLDRLRRQQGAMLDALGLGPVEAPHREVFRAPGVRLRRYGSGEESGPPVLIVPAPPQFGLAEYAARLGRNRA